MFISTRAKALGGKQGLNYYPPPLFFPQKIKPRALKGEVLCPRATANPDGMVT